MANHCRWLLLPQSLRSHVGHVVRVDDCRLRGYMRFDTVLQRDVAHPSHGLVAVDLTVDFGREEYKIYRLLPRLQ